MDNTIKKLLLTAMLLSATYINGASNKTFLSPRPIGIDRAMESVTFTEVCNTQHDTHLGGNFELTSFYAKSTNKSDLGSYFSPSGKKSFTAQTANAPATNGVATPPPAGVDLNAGLIMYDYFYPTSNDFDKPTSIQFQPSQEIYGFKFSYYQNLDNILKGLYLRAKLPLVRVKNNMGLSLVNTQNGAEKTGAQMVSLFSQYFDGTLSIVPDMIGNGAIRFPLQKALVDGKGHSKSGIADLEVVLGYTFLEREKYSLAFNLGLIIPTGNIPNGRYAFEPVCGNGGHIGLGLGYEFSWHIWGKENANIKFNSSLDWRYLFEATETRTFGITSGTFPKGFGQYGITTITQLNATSNNVRTSPVANVSTIKAKVTPGNIVDGIAGFTYNYKNFSIDLGYNLFYKDSESAHHATIVDAANSLFVSCSNDLSTGTLNANTEAVALTNNLLDNNSAASASQFSNKVYGGIGYIFKDMEYPINLAVGGHYEFAANNATIENWGVHIKSGISF